MDITIYIIATALLLIIIRVSFQVKRLNNERIETLRKVNELCLFTGATHQMHNYQIIPVGFINSSEKRIENLSKRLVETNEIIYKIKTNNIKNNECIYMLNENYELLLNHFNLEKQTTPSEIKLVKKPTTKR